jgi:hypothetical protein
MERSRGSRNRAGKNWNSNQKFRFVYAGALGLTLEQLPTVLKWMLAELHNNRINELGETALERDLQRHPNTQYINEILELMSPMDPFTRTQLKPVIGCVVKRITIERPAFLGDIDYMSARTRGREAIRNLHEMLKPQGMH